MGTDHDSSFANSWQVIEVFGLPRLGLEVELIKNVSDELAELAMIPPAENG